MGRGWTVVLIQTEAALRAEWPASLVPPLSYTPEKPDAGPQRKS